MFNVLLYSDKFQKHLKNLTDSKFFNCMLYVILYLNNCTTLSLVTLIKSV